MIFISAGHTLLGVKEGTHDNGAIGTGTTEAKETVDFRNLVCKELDLIGCKYITDNDNESLSQYLKRIKPDSSSVVIEFHFNAFNSKSTGVEVIIEDEADRLDNAFAKELVDISAKLMQLTNRGVKKESLTARKRLGLMREEGIIALVELCFIDNASDMKNYWASMSFLAKKYAEIIKKYENIIP